MRFFVTHTRSGYTWLIPVVQFNPEDTQDPLGEWRAGMDFRVNEAMGYWVARSWPVGRVLVFAMGCLAALNRLAAAKRQASRDAEADSAAVVVDEADRGYELGVPQMYMVNALVCPCCGDKREVFDNLCCTAELPAIMSPGKPEEIAWAKQTDRCIAVYVLVIAAAVTFETVVVPIGARLQLEALLPMLELSIIISLTYDGRQSWTSRFCNWGPVQWLGNISMSFYMVHMIAIGIVNEWQLVVRVDSTASACDNYEPGNGFPSCALLSLEGRIGEACNYDPVDDTCTGEFRPWEICAAQRVPECIGYRGGELEGGLPEGWGSEAEFCAACIDAWSWLQPATYWWLLPVVLALGLAMGWLLTRWVELPAQTLLRGDKWRWKSQRYCCTGDDAHPAACRCFPSCCPWECCCVVYSCACCCFCKCCTCCRRTRHDGYESLPS
eukprot:SAG31_NODE_2366_length_5859_cov_4.794097_5_plen_439_part_00